jgi:hypothetical protein
MTFIDLPIRDEACKTGKAEHYGLAFFDWANDNQARQQFLLGGRAVKDPFEVLHLADQAVAPIGLESEYPKGQVKYFAAAATILRLCMKHDQPQLEVVTNVVAQTGEPPYAVNGSYFYGDGERVARFSAGVTYRGGITSYTNWPDDPSFITNSRVRTLYLPQAHLKLAEGPHFAVTANRGGRTNPLRVGILGTEVVIPADTHPDMYPDY